MKAQEFFGLVLVLALLVMSSGASAATPFSASAQGDGPVITGVSGASAFVHGTSVTISGTGFGPKSLAAPWRASYMHPIAVQNYQAIDMFDSDYWSPNEMMISLHDNDDLTFARTNRDTHRYCARLEYSERGNWGSLGYSAGINVNLPQTGRDYVAWWEYWQADFDFSVMHTGNGNIKWIYFTPGGNPATALMVNNDGDVYFSSASGGVAGDTPEEQNANLILPFGGGFYGRPLSWTATHPVPKGEWHFVEILIAVNSESGVQDGWYELRINNQTVWRANNIDIFSPGDHDPDYRNVRLGGNYGWDGGPERQYRYYGDMYLDGTFQRVVIGDQPVFEQCRHLELQIPTSWQDNTITAMLNLGAFNDDDTVYLYAIDENNDPSEAYPLTLGDTAVTDLRVTHAITDTSALTATLRWTAPINAVTYTMRYSDTSISEDNWANSVTITVPFTASTPGSAEWLTTPVAYTGGPSARLRQSSAEPSGRSTVYFALKAQNAVGDWSGLSNNAFWPRVDVYLPLVMRES